MNRITHRYLPVLLSLVVLGTSLIITSLIGPTGIILPGDDLTLQNILILQQIRIPRVLGAALVGSCLATAGCLMQALFRNSLADPYLLGTSSGGALGAAVSMILSVQGAIVPGAFAGCLGANLLVAGIARRNGRIRVETLLLSGIAISILLSALISFILFCAGDNLHQIVFWLMGGLWTVSWSDIMIGIIVIPVFLSLFIFARELNVYSLGEEQAISLGQNVEMLKRLLILVTSLLTAVSVSIAGTIGFIGLITPHIMRLWAGPDHRRLLLLSMTGGAILVVWADTIARTLGNEMPVGIITALLGVPFFLFLLRRETI